MRRATSILLAGALVVGAGVSVFQSFSVSAGRFSGTISTGGAAASSGGGVDSLTAGDVQAAMLGEDLSVNTVVVTQADPAQPSFILNGGRFLWVPTSVNNAYAYWDTSNGLRFTSGLMLGANQNFRADSIISSQGDRPPAINGSFGLLIVPQSSIGECGTTAEPEGTHKVLSGAIVSGPTRFCDCGSDGGGTPAYAWVNTHCPATAGTSSSCPACP